MASGSKMAQPAAASPPKTTKKVKAEPKSPPAPKAALPRAGQEMANTAPDPGAGQALALPKAKAAPKYDPIPKDAAKRMNYKLKQRPDLAVQYSQCKSQHDKRKFFYDVYCLDPNVSERTVQKVDTERTSQIEDLIDDWFTAQEVAEHKGIKQGTANYEQLCAACVKGLPERDHEDSNLAEMGVKQYKYVASKTKRQVVRDQALMLKEEVEEVEQQDFVAMRNALKSGTAQKMITSSKTKGVENPGQEVATGNEDTEVKVDWQQAYEHQHKKLKSSMSAIGSELHVVDVLMAKADGLPEGNDLKAIALKQLKALKARMETEKVDFLAEHRLFQKEVQEDEGERQTEKLKVLTEQIHSKLQGWRKELSVQKKMLE